MEKLLTVKELSSKLNIHPNTIYKWRNQGRIPYIKRNGLIRFIQKDIDDWLNQGSSKTDSLLESLTKVDLALEQYDKLFLKGVRMSQKGKTWNYPFGSVFLRLTKTGKERWYIYYRVEGKRVRQVVQNAQSRADALKVLQIKVADAFRGRHGFKQKEKQIKFTEFAELYLINYAKVNKNSWKDDEYCIEKLKKFFRNSYLHETSSFDVEKAKAELVKKRKPSRVNRYLALLKKMFNLAIDWGYVKENPVNRVEFFSEKDNLKERILSEDEEERLLEECAEHLKPIVVTALHTGMRRGEILSLKWNQVNLLKRIIRVEKTKSGKIRYIPMNDVLFEELIKLKKQNGKSDHVFLYPRTKKPIADVKTAFNAAKKDAGIKDLRFHDLRHTFASRLVERGVDLITVMDLLGHHSVVVTQRYTHSRADQKMNAVQNLIQKEDKSPEFVPILSPRREDFRLNALFTVN
jgi:excisionase family DNA binding protein